MPVVAVAGGTGNVGRAIVEAIVATGKYEVVILSRKSNPERSAELGVPIIPVDYTDVDALARTLEDRNIHTVVSALVMMPSPNGDLPREVELIQAADKSRATKRFISSDWGLPHTAEHITQLVSVKFKLDAEKALENTKDLETTRFLNGFFLDYFGLPKFPSHMPPTTMVLDVANNAAAIPGSGDVPAVFTHTSDVAKFVAASLDLDNWDPVHYVIGDRVTWNEFLHLAEEAKGTKFKVVYDPIEKLQSGKVTELPGHIAAYPYFPKEILQKFAATFALWWATGAFDFKPKSTLNDRLPSLGTLKVKELLDRAWK
ncbi:unnamed protein product [Clonostachys byssicola]|uniref:NmrA-like domain-containing protein n=1 Tax=Clonostachys byssicola TaxID=160290 RepID=A0A9N9V0K8_9HYPO|nr:unnamed protein product [Clonostachys byssicola]